MIQSAPRTSALPLYTVLEEEYRQLGKIAPGAPPPTTWRLVAEHIIDPVALVEQLASGADAIAATGPATEAIRVRQAIARYILRKAPRGFEEAVVAQAVAQAAARAAATGPRLALPSAGMVGRLAEVLNATLIEADSAFAATCFDHLILDPPAAALRGRLLSERHECGVRPDDREQIGRLLLEAAFPACIRCATDVRLDELYEIIHQRERADGPRPAPLSALCLSGGGIRSATFALGVVQGFAERNVLDRFDYLSTVSGGGYLGAWLSAWIANEGMERVVAKLPCRPPAAGPALNGDGAPPLGPTLEKLDPEPTPIQHLRSFSHYLSPNPGLFSADTWTLVATYVRNLLLNWLVLLPLLAAVLLVPTVAMSVVASKSNRWAPLRLSLLPLWLIAIALVLGAVAVGYVHWIRPHGRRDAASAESEPTPAREIPRSLRTQRAFLLYCLAPLIAAVVLLTTAWYWLEPHGWAAALLGTRESGVDLEPLANRAFYFGLYAAAMHLVGWIGSRLVATRWGPQSSTVGEFLGEGLVVLLTGSLAGALMSGVTEVTEAIAEYGGGTANPTAYTWVALPLFLAALVLGNSVYIGWMSRHGERDPEREWTARFTAWVLIVVVAWIAGGGLALYGWSLLQRAFALYPRSSSALGVLSGILTLKLGGSPKTEGSRDDQKEKVPTTKTATERLVARARPFALALAAPVFTALVVVLLASGGTAAVHGATVWLDGMTPAPARGAPAADLTLPQALLLSQTRLDSLHPAPAPVHPLPARRARGDRAAWLQPIYEATPPSPVVAAATLLLLASFGLGMAALIDTNKFSLHGMYRARLIRAFLGASRPAGARYPNPFTGFDERDNVDMAALWPDDASRRTRRPPLHIVNTALNLVRAEKLAWQDRKAESFTITPLHAGAPRLGYRRVKSPLAAERFGGEQGITLGTAITISGAAASPNMGYHSSPLVTFLMTLFNARLGWWLGNPGPAGDHTFHRATPKLAVRPIVDELFGNTSDVNAYVYLSDGGHFENLGLYEMVLRRCKAIVVCDASCDAVGAFEDLGNAIRKIRVDLGVPIEFDDPFEVRPRGAGRGRYFAWGKVRYSCVDRVTARGEGGEALADAEIDGCLLYIKPCFYGREPRDVFNYAQSSLAFPHESTLDQSFSESQFESYRALGQYIASQIPYDELDAMLTAGSRTAVLDRAHVRRTAWRRRGAPDQPAP